MRTDTLRSKYVDVAAEVAVAGAAAELAELDGFLISVSGRCAAVAVCVSG